MKVSVIIPAAGLSRRFGVGDKLGQDLGGRAVLLRTVELFAPRSEVAEIIVAGPPGEAFAAFRERFAPTLSFHGASVVEGGAAARSETVQRALAAVDSAATHVAVHDAARPGTSKALLDRVFAAAARYPAVVPGLPVTSTVKRVTPDVEEADARDDDAIADAILGDAGKEIVRTRIVAQTIDRTDLIETQTPQIFEIDLFRRIYAADGPLSGGDIATDDASLVELLGETVRVVDGEARNFKITTPDDLALMRAVLGLTAPAERPVHKRF